MSHRDVAKFCPKCNVVVQRHPNAVKCRVCGESYQCTNCVATRRHMLLLAKLACKKAMFCNPLEAMAAETLRDDLLRQAGLGKLAGLDETEATA
jgi:hypothetical protein